MEEELLPELPVGQARVRVRSIGLNFADVFACLGLYSAAPRGPFVPGLEFSGEVEGLSRGGNASSIQVGDRVMGVTRFGAFSSLLHVDCRYLRHIPHHWSFSEGAALPVQGLTAWYALKELGSLTRGQSVFVHSAAGGVGLNALAILKSYSSCIVGSVGNESKAEFLRNRMGSDRTRVIVREERPFGEAVDQAFQELGIDGFDIVLDSVAGPCFRPLFDRLRPAGRMILFGAASMMPSGSRPNYLHLGFRYLQRPKLDPLEMIAQNRSLMAFNLIWLWDSVDLLQRLFDEMQPCLAGPPFVGKHFPFEGAVDALAFLQSGKSMGKVVLDLD
jgi:alcohol dehydrogenase